MERLNKEYELDVNDKFVIRYGSVNRKFPIVIYVNGKTWVQPTSEFDYVSSIREICKSFKNNLRKQLSLSDIFHNKMIIDFDISVASIEKGKKKFLSFEVYLKQKGEVLSLADIQFTLKNIIGNAVDNMAENLINNTFILSREKKQ